MNLDLEQIVAIEANSFASQHFELLERLFLRNMKLTKLDTNVFNGLFALKYLIVETMPLISVDENFLWPMNATLSLLQMNALSTIDLNNMMPNPVEMVALQTVTIAYSSIDRIGDNALSSLSAVTTLKINYCGVKVIDPKAFVAILDSVQLIDLQYNELKTISEETFAVLVDQSRSIQVFLSQNPWNCHDMDMTSVIDLINSNPDVFDDRICESEATARSTVSSGTSDMETSLATTTTCCATTPSSAGITFVECYLIVINVAVLLIC